MFPLPRRNVLLLLAAILQGCGSETAPIAPVLGEATPGTDPAAGGEGQGRAAPATADTGSAAGAPHLLYPAPGSRVSSAQPTFRWTLPPYATGAGLEICRDRACAHPEQTVVLHGTSGRFPEALGKGVHFVRLRGTAETGLLGPATAPIALHVRARTGAVDTAWGGAPDTDGDGLADLALTVGTTSSAPAGVLVRRGTPQGIAAGERDPAVHLLAPATATGEAVASAGDVNGDGFADLLLAHVDAAGHRTVDVHLGDASGPRTKPVVTLDVEGTGEGAPRAIAAGDLDGDGFGDVIVTSAFGVLHVHPGYAGGVAAPFSLAISGYVDVAPAGDVNGDQYADVLAARPVSGGALAVDVLLGGPGGLSDVPFVTLGAPVTAFASAGDVNGDGYADVAVVEATPSSASPFRLHVFAGSAQGTPAAPSWSIASPAYAGTKTPTLAAVGDVNGDGFDDVLVGCPEVLYGAMTVQPLLTRAVLYPGAAAGPSAAGATTFGLPGSATDFDGSFGATIAGLGDVDGDGFDDLYLGTGEALAPGLGLGAIQSFAYVHRGSAAGPAAVPSTTITSAAGDALFGRSVARAH